MLDSSTLKHRVISGFSWQGGSKFLVQSASWVSTVLVARLLTPNDYGVVAAAGVFTGLLILLTELGLSQGLIQKSEITPEEEDAVFYFSLIVSVCAYMVLFIAAPYIATFYKMAVLTDFLRLSGIVILLGALRIVPVALAMREMDFKYRAHVEMGSTAAGIATVLGLAYQGYGVWSLAWGTVGAGIVSTLAYLPLLRRIPAPRFRIQAVAAVGSYGAKVTLTNLLYYVYGNADFAIVGKLLGERILGFYSIAVQMAMIPLDKIAPIFSQVMFPLLSRIQNDLEQSKKLFLTLHRYLLVISYPIACGVALIAHDLVVFLLTDKWLSAVPIMQGLCIVASIRVSAVVLPPVLNARGRPGTVAKISIITAVTMPIVVLLGAYYQGIAGVIIAWIAVYPIIYLLMLRACLRELSISFAKFFQSFIPAVVSTALMAVAVLLVQAGMETSPIYIRLLSAIAAGAITYLASLGLLYGDHVSEFKQGIVLLRGRAT